MKLILVVAAILAFAACHRDVDLRPPEDAASDAAFDTDAQLQPDAEPLDAGP